MSLATGAVAESGESDLELLSHLGREHTEQDGIHKSLPRISNALRGVYIMYSEHVIRKEIYFVQLPFP